MECHSLLMYIQGYGMPQFVPSQPQYMPPAPVPPVAMTTDSSMPMLLSETRTQTTEMRMTLSKVADKVDMISGKVSAVKLGYIEVQGT